MRISTWDKDSMFKRFQVKHCNLMVPSPCRDRKKDSLSTGKDLREPMFCLTSLGIRGGQDLRLPSGGQDLK